MKRALVQSVPKTKLEAITHLSQVTKTHTMLDKELKMLEEHIHRRAPVRATACAAAVLAGLWSRRWLRRLCFFPEEMALTCPEARFALPPGCGSSARMPTRLLRAPSSKPTSALASRPLPPLASPPHHTHPFFRFPTHPTTTHPNPPRPTLLRTLALAKHPDKVARQAKAKAVEEGRDPVQAVEDANANFQRIRVAYDVLGDPELRRDYVDMLDHDKFEEQRARRTREKAKTPAQGETLRLQAGLPNRCTCPFVDDVSPAPEDGQPPAEHAAALLEWRCRDAEYRNVVGYEIQGSRTGSVNWELLESGVPWDKPRAILTARSRTAPLSQPRALLSRSGRVLGVSPRRSSPALLLGSGAPHIFLPPLL